jgi:NAD(P)-dependent dehydrogenase (short-subunit alcohol dehydrogenase family)
MSNQPRTAIVTGASQGIGAGIVKAFVERGFNAVGNSLKVTESTEVAASARVAAAALMITNGGLETVA